MTYQNEYNSYMLDDYGLPSYSSRRNSYNYGYNDSTPSIAPGQNLYPPEYGRKFSTISANSTATKVLDLPRNYDNYVRQSSTEGLVLDQDQRAGIVVNCYGKRIRSITASIIIIIGVIIMIIGICFLAFKNDGKSDALEPLGYFFVTFGSLIILIMISVIFMPYQPGRKRKYEQKEQLKKLEAPTIVQNTITQTQQIPTSQVPVSRFERSISNIELDRENREEETNLGTPKITITSDEIRELSKTNTSREIAPRISAIESGDSSGSGKRVY